MSWFQFVAGRLLEVVKGAANNTDVQKAAEGAIKGIARRGLDAINKGNIAEAKALLTEAEQGAPQIVGAVFKGTPAETLVDPEIIHRTDDELKALGRLAPDPIIAAEPAPAPAPKRHEPEPEHKVPKPAHRGR